MANRESGRIKDSYQKRILDDAARKRRQKKALEALEQDNFHEDPHADLGTHILTIQREYGYSFAQNSRFSFSLFFLPYCTHCLGFLTLNVFCLYLS